MIETLTDVHIQPDPDDMYDLGRCVETPWVLSDR